jgi:putative membrane protein
MKSTKIIYRFTAILGVIALSACSAAFAQTSGQQRTAQQDTKFLEKANQGSVDEVDLAQLVLKKSNNEDVKAFAQQMVTDHTALLDNMKPFDAEAGLTVPNHPDAATEANKIKLAVLTGSAFDKAYIKAMVEDHSKDLKEFMAEEKSTAYPAFKTAVGKGEQVVRGHLKMIDDIAKKNGVAPAAVPAAGM